LSEVFPFFSDARNLEVLTPPWLKFKILTPGRIEMTTGTRIDYRIGWHGLPMRWKTEIILWDPPRAFVDLQLSGPYRLWRHTHRFEECNGGTLLTDTVRYALPFGWLGRIVHALTVGRNVEQIFAYRQEKVRELFGSPAAVPARGRP
jgi:hypothetical protein